MTQTLPFSRALGSANTGKLIGYRILDIDRVQYSAFTTTGVVETNIAGTYAVVGGVVLPDVGGYIVIGEEGNDLLEWSIDPVANALASLDDKLDAIKAITDAIDVSDVTYVATNNAGTLTITIGRTFSAIVSGLSIPADWETAYWTLKRNVVDNDNEALVQIVVTNPGDENIDGLRCLNAVVWHEAVEDDEETEEDETDPEPFDRELASLTVDQPGGRVTIYLQDDLTTQLAIAKRIEWDVKFIDANSDSTGTRGLANLLRTETQTV